MKPVIQKVLFMLIVLLLVPAAYLLASPSAPGNNSDAGAPIDGGISLLVAAGIGYGVKKVRETRKKAKPSPTSDDTTTII